MRKFYTITCTLLCLVSASRSMAQTDSLVYFFDKNFEQTTREKTIYVGIAVKQGNLYKLNIFDNQSEIMVITGYYSDSLLKASEGLFQYFELDGTLTERGTFVHGKKEGPWLNFYRSGKVKDSSYYEKDNWISKYEYRNDGSIIREAHRNGKKLEQKEYRENGKLSLYQGFGEDGKMAFQGGYDENGELVKPFSNKEIEALKKDFESKMPEYPGGQAGFQYWVDNLRIPPFISTEMNSGEIVTINFLLDELGKAYNITTSKSGEFTEFIKDQLSRSPHWKMKGYKKWGPINFSIRF